MMKRIIVLAISLHIIVMHAEPKPAFGVGNPRSDARSLSFPSRFNHRRPVQNLPSPITWNQLTDGLQHVVVGIKDAITDKRIYGPLSNMASATKENLVAGAQKIGDIGSRMAGYLAAKGKDLGDSVSGVIKLVMNDEGDPGKRVNAWRSGFEMAREQSAQRMRTNVPPAVESDAIQVTEQETTPSPEPIAKDEPVPVPEELPVSLESPITEQPPEEPIAPEPEQPVVTEQTIVTEETILPEKTEPEAAPVVEPESTEPFVVQAEEESIEATKIDDAPASVALPVLVEPIAIEQPPEEPIVPEPEQPVVREPAEPELVSTVEPEQAAVVVALPVQEPQEFPPVQEILVQEIKKPVQEPKPIVVQEPITVQRPSPTPIAPTTQPAQPAVVVTPQEVVVPEPTVEVEKIETRKLPVLQEASKTILEKEEYRPVRKKRRPVVNEEAIDLFDVQSAFARPEPYPNYHPSPFMNVSQPMPMYQQQMPMMVQQQPMPVMGYQFNQNPLSSAAMQMQSSAMAMQAQAATMLAQAQQQPSMQWQQPYQQAYTRPSSMRENTKQEKAALGMQAIQQVVNAGEGAVQHLLHILDLEFDILEHLLAGNVGQRVDHALRERNNTIKNSNPIVVTAYDRLMELATTYGNDDDIGARLYHYCVRKSKRVMKSPMISQAKKKFLLHMMCVLEQYYEIIEKMLRVANLKY